MTTTKLKRDLMLLLSLTATVVLLACSREQTQQQGNAATNKNAIARATEPEKKTKATGSITADPNPIKVCDGTGTGITTLTWSATGTTLVEVHMASPDGAVFAQTGPSGGTKITGKWVGNGAVAYLQDVSDGKPLTPEYTIAKITLLVSAQGCP